MVLPFRVFPIWRAPNEAISVAEAMLMITSVNQIPVNVLICLLEPVNPCLKGYGTPLGNPTLLSIPRVPTVWCSVLTR